MPLTTKEILLEYVCPLLGCIFANLMFLAPLKAVREATENRTLGNLNPTPWAVMTGNCAGWITYSFLIKSQFLFWANAPGFLLSVWLNMAAAKLQFCDHIHQYELKKNEQSMRESIAVNTSSRDDWENDIIDNDSDAANRQNVRKSLNKAYSSPSHEKKVLVIVFLWLTIVSFISSFNLTQQQREFIVGGAVNLNLLFFYGAPLTTILTVLKTRDSSSVHPRTMWMNTACAVFWTGFGIGTFDYFIIVINGLGVVLGLIQICLRMVIPCKTGENEPLPEEGKIQSADLGDVKDADV